MCVCVPFESVATCSRLLIGVVRIPPRATPACQRVEMALKQDKKAGLSQNASKPKNTCPKPERKGWEIQATCVGEVCSNKLCHSVLKTTMLTHIVQFLPW